MSDETARERPAERRPPLPTACGPEQREGRLQAWFRRLANPRPSDIWMMEPDGRLCRVQKQE